MNQADKMFSEQNEVEEMGVYVIEVAGRAIGAVGDVTAEQAEDYRDDEAFRSDLLVFNTAGKPLWDGESEIYLRSAFGDEVERWEALKNQALRDGEHEDGEEFFIWLVPLEDDDLAEEDIG